MKEMEVERCQIQEWYPRFRADSIATRIVKLPEVFVSHLLDDGFFVDRSSDSIPVRTTPDVPELQADEYEKWEEEDGDEGEAACSFPELEAEVRSSIQELGGAVFPKLNWSAPKDAVWISSSKNLKCSSFGEIRLLLKASDSAVHDLCHAFDNCDDKSRERPEEGEFVLALRKWYDLKPEMELRAFVRDGVLVGICQREVTSFYPCLEAIRERLGEAVSQFFAEKISGKFELDSYTFDVYVTRDWRVKLLDFNPWGGSTLPLLFSWEELLDIAALELRIVESQGMVVQPNLAMASGVPFDYIQTGPGSAWDDFLSRAKEQQQQQQGP